MARYTDAVCRLCRRERMKLYLKGERCFTAKCAIQRRNQIPGMHPWSRGAKKEYGERLREKQKVKRFYGILDAQFRRFYEMAEKQRGDTGINLLILLERRLDNVVRRAHFAVSVRQARQFVVHRHIAVNGKIIDIPSYLLKPGDVISPAQRETSKRLVQEAYESGIGLEIPSWLSIDEENLTAKMIEMPNREEVPIEVREQLIVEFASK